MKKEIADTINNFYVFYILDGDNIYERTCGVKDAAIERVDQLKKQYGNAFYTLNTLPNKYFY